jgi:hypothetical protein
MIKILDTQENGNFFTSLQLSEKNKHIKKLNYIALIYPLKLTDQQRKNTQ